MARLEEVSGPQIAMRSSSPILLECVPPRLLAIHGDIPHTHVYCAQEMFRQGDRERAMGQPVSPLMDRTKGGVTKSQTGFFNLVALPMYTVGVGVG